MKSAKRTYTILCTKPLLENQVIKMQSFLGIDAIEYKHPKFTCVYDLSFISRELIIKHLNEENIVFKYSFIHKISNAIEIFSEKTIIKNNRLPHYYGRF